MCVPEKFNPFFDMVYVANFCMLLRNILRQGMIWKMTIETISDVQGIKVFAAPVADTAVGNGNPGKSTSEDISDLPRLSGIWISHLFSLFRGSVRSFLNPYIEVML